MDALELGFHSIEIDEVLNNIHNANDFLLPAIQRDVVWDDKDIVKLYDSIYRSYPFGNILVLLLNGEEDKNITTFYMLNKENKDQHLLFAGESFELVGDDKKYCIIDGQQRLSALYRGRFLSYKNKKDKEMRLYFNVLDGCNDANKEDDVNKDDDVNKEDDVNKDGDASKDDNDSNVNDAFKYIENELRLFEDNGLWLPLKACLGLKLVCKGDEVKVEGINIIIKSGLDKLKNLTITIDQNGKQKINKKNNEKFEKIKKLVDNHKDKIHENVKTLLEKFKKDKLLNYNLITFDGYTDEQKQERILEIFTRLNKGGKRLAPADLLYSQIATYSSEEIGVRDCFGRYMEELNNSSTQKINFKLKTFIRLLWLLFGEPKKSFNSFYVSKAIKEHCTLAKFNKAFEALKKAKQIYLDSYFKFTDNIAYNMFLPIAYYFYYCDYDKFNSNEQEEIRYEISKYFEVATISRFVSSEHSDSALKSIKNALNKNSDSNCIALFADNKFNFKLLQDEVNNNLSSGSKRFEVTDKDIEKILTFDYDKNRQEIVQLFYLLNKDLVKSKTKIEREDVDHMHPKSLNDEGKYRSALSNANNFVTESYEFFSKNHNLLPNLQLLVDKENRDEKRAKMLDEWLKLYKKNKFIEYMKNNFAIDDTMNVSLDYFKIENFEKFYNKRKSIIEAKLKELFGI